MAYGDYGDELEMKLPKLNGEEPIIYGNSMILHI